MASATARISSFSRSVSGGNPIQNHFFKSGPNGTLYISSGISDLDKILGGGFTLGSLVIIMEDAETPHHMLLLRNFMSQGLVHHQPLLYAAPLASPAGFLGTLPAPGSPGSDKSLARDRDEGKDLRIAWQYKKYFSANNSTSKEVSQEYCNEFDVRKPLERNFISHQRIECLSFNDFEDLIAVKNRCQAFFSQNLRDDATCRVVIQSLCAPQCAHSYKEWETLGFLRWLKTSVQSSKGVACVSFPPSLLSPSFCARVQHVADVVLSVRSIQDDDKEIAKLLTGYNEMIGFVNVHKVSRPNSQVPLILEATTFSIKLQKRRFLVFESLNQAPVDGASASCSTSSNQNKLEF